MTYSETLDYLFNVAPLFQNIGQGAYKEGLSNTHTLDEHFGHPHRKFRTIHVAGTNGKGSCSHTLAAILQSSGLRVGLYTSPHLVDFRERIRVNGEMISEQRVIDFVEQERSFFEPLYPSFFELTTALAFKYFEEQEVDVAVIEVGLGGRLDCTNIIQPDLSIITNISFDHVQFLGDTLEKIAAEKAGIIKHNTPVVIGETNGHDGVKQVFLNKAKEQNAPIIFADETGIVISSTPAHLHTPSTYSSTPSSISHTPSSDSSTPSSSTPAPSANSRTSSSSTPAPSSGFYYATRRVAALYGELGGACQVYNTATILNAVEQLRIIGYNISDDDIRNGFANVCKMTGLMGRWQQFATAPLSICDTGHNVGGLQYIATQLEAIRPTDGGTLRMVIGMVGDKDVSGSLALLPKEATYYFTQASVKRAMDVKDIQKIAEKLGLHGNCYPTVADAYAAAKTDSDVSDLIFVGGSSFIVADLLSNVDF